MSWNYRIVKDKDEDLKEEYYALSEVYYSKDGRVMGVTSPIFTASSLEELKSTLFLMGEAFEKKVLDKTDHGGIMQMQEPNQW